MWIALAVTAYALMGGMVVGWWDHKSAPEAHGIATISLPMVIGFAAIWPLMLAFRIGQLLAARSRR